MKIQTKNSECVVLDAQMDRQNAEAHQLRLHQSQIGNQIRILEGKIIQLENEIARLENLSIASGSARGLGPAAMAAASAASQAIRAQTIAAKISPENAKVDLGRTEDQLIQVTQKITAVGDSIASTRTRRRDLGCA